MPKFKIDHYEKTLGLALFTDLSHPEFLEVLEKSPNWVRLLVSVVAKNTEAVNVLHKEFPKELSRELKPISSSFDKSMQEHLDIIKFFREESIKRHEESSRRTSILEEESKRRTEQIEKLVKKLLTERKRKRKKKPKPKPKPLWKRVLRIK